MVHNQARMVGVANDQHCEIRSCRLPIAVSLSTERLHCTHGIGQQVVCREEEKIANCMVLVRYRFGVALCCRLRYNFAIQPALPLAPSPRERGRG
jgi:hypothetical protein